VHALVFHDLVTAPAAATGSVYWLRLYADGESRVAVATEVPGNRGQSVLNATDDLLEAARSRPAGDASPLTLYLVAPAGSIAEERLVWRVEEGAETRWPDADLAEIELRVGQPLSPLPGHEALLERVLALGGDAQDTVDELVFSAIPVTGLPAPHLPRRCALFGHFESMAAEAGVEVSQEVGARFIASLAPDDRASCRYHVDDWRSVAEESVRILEAAASGSREEMSDRARRAELGEAERRWLVSLFDSPVDIRGGGYTDGQHRGCALRFSGAEAAAVVTGIRTRKVEPMVWVYSGDG
jgi:hypothetical protein